MENNRHIVSSTRPRRQQSPGRPTEGQQLSQVGSQDGPRSVQNGPRSFHVAPYSKASFGSSRDYDAPRAVDVERLNSPWRRRADGNDSEAYTGINQSRLSDVLSLSDRLAGRPDLISKTAAAAAEFRRLQEYEQVFRKTVKRSVIVIACSMPASMLCAHTTRLLYAIQNTCRHTIGYDYYTPFYRFCMACIFMPCARDSKVAAHLEPGKQQESRKIDARLQAQIEMQRQELAESRRILLEETCAYNRERAFSEARTAALEKEVTELKSSVRAGAENHDRERREWELEKNELRSKNTSLQVCSSHHAHI